MKYRSMDILGIDVITIVAIILIFTVTRDNQVVRILTLPLVLVFPGYVVTSALFPGPSPGFPERLVFSLGLSLAIVILCGLLLNATPFGLGPGSWAIFLGTITFGASAVALMRRYGQGGVTTAWSGIEGPGLTLRQGLLLGLAVLILCGVIVMSIAGAEQQPRPGFTQLWILAAKGPANAKNVVSLGVSNMEAKAMEYRLVVEMDGKTIKVWSSIHLSSNDKWQATLLLPQTGQVGSTEVVAMLYRAQAPTIIYRNAILWLGT